jgi:hypothetical protein
VNRNLNVGVDFNQMVEKFNFIAVLLAKTPVQALFPGSFYACPTEKAVV